MDATNTQDQGTQGQVQDQNGTAADTTPAKLYATKAEAEANKPANASKALRPYEVTKNGTSQGWLLAKGYAECAVWAARNEGYRFSTGGSKEVTKEAVAAKLATFTDDELKALGLQRKKGKN